MRGRRLPGNTRDGLLRRWVRAWGLRRLTSRTLANIPIVILLEVCICRYDAYDHNQDCYTAKFSADSPEEFLAGLRLRSALSAAGSSPFITNGIDRFVDQGVRLTISVKHLLFTSKAPDIIPKMLTFILKKSVLTRAMSILRLCSEPTTCRVE